MTSPTTGRGHDGGVRPGDEGGAFSHRQNEVVSIAAGLGLFGDDGKENRPASTFGPGWGKMPLLLNTSAATARPSRNKAVVLPPRQGFSNLTPGPPPFFGMNITPADSSAL
jgi:hypothetical protein